MAHPYSTEARVKRALAGKGERLLELLDRNADGIADTDGTTSVIDATLQIVANDLDGRLAQVYEVPFASATPASPGYEPTYAQVADLCDLGVIAELWEWKDPGSGDAETAREKYETRLREYREGVSEIPGAAKVSSTEGGRSWAFEGLGPRLGGRDSSGRNDGAYTDDTTDPTDAI